MYHEFPCTLCSFPFRLLSLSSALTPARFEVSSGVVKSLGKVWNTFLGQTVMAKIFYYK